MIKNDTPALSSAHFILIAIMALIKTDFDSLFFSLYTLIQLLLKAHKEPECAVTVPTIRPMRTYYEKLCHGYVSNNDRIYSL